jgi:hypothetical protein
MEEVMRTRKGLIVTAILCLSAATYGQTPPAANQLHPAFVFSRDDVAALMKKGEEAARKHKRAADLAGKLMQKPRWGRDDASPEHPL